MIDLQKISHQDINIEEKVNYFIEALSYITDNIGEDYTLELENHNTILTKILFQLNNNSKHSLKYLEIYFEHRFFQIDELWSGYEGYTSVKELITLFKQSNKKTRKEILDKVSFRTKMANLLEEVQFKMSSALSEALMGVIHCPKPLNQHKHKDKLFTIAKLYVSEYLNSGRSKKEIYDIIENVFSHELVKFPFPDDIRSIREKRKHLRSKDLTNQLRGFSNVFCSKEKN